MFTEAMNQRFNTPIVSVGLMEGNQVYMKRDDLIPYSFGGNKARKAFLFCREIDKGGYDIDDTITVRVTGVYPLSESEISAS